MIEDDDEVYINLPGGEDALTPEEILIHDEEILDLIAQPEEALEYIQKLTAMFLALYDAAQEPTESDDELYIIDDGEDE